MPFNLRHAADALPRAPLMLSVRPGLWTPTHRQQRDRIAHRDRAGLDHPEEPPAPAFELLRLSPGLISFMRSHGAHMLPVSRTAEPMRSRVSGARSASTMPRTVTCSRTAPGARPKWSSVSCSMNSTARLVRARAVAHQPLIGLGMRRVDRDQRPRDPVLKWSATTGLGDDIRALSLARRRAALLSQDVDRQVLEVFRRLADRLGHGRMRVDRLRQIAAVEIGRDRERALVNQLARPWRR